MLNFDYKLIWSLCDFVVDIMVVCVVVCWCGIVGWFGDVLMVGVWKFVVDFVGNGFVGFDWLSGVML